MQLDFQPLEHLSNQYYSLSKDATQVEYIYLNLKL